MSIWVDLPVETKPEMAHSEWPSSLWRLLEFSEDQYKVYYFLRIKNMEV